MVAADTSPSLMLLSPGFWEWIFNPGMRLQKNRRIYLLQMFQGAFLVHVCGSVRVLLSCYISRFRFHSIQFVTPPLHTFMESRMPNCHETCVSLSRLLLLYNNCKSEWEMDWLVLLDLTKCGSGCRLTKKKKKMKCRTHVGTWGPLTAWQPRKVWGWIG